MNACGQLLHHKAVRTQLQTRSVCRAAPAHSAGRRSAVPVCSAAVRAVAGPNVRIDVDKTSWNSRRIIASVSIATPKRVVWSALTDYENLGKFIPSLVENRCIERKGSTCVLYQVGAQDVAMGVKFSAACTLRCAEHPDGGAPASLLTSSTSPEDLEVRFPMPPAPLTLHRRPSGSSSPCSASSSSDGSSPSTPSLASASLAPGMPDMLSQASAGSEDEGAGAGASTSDITFELLEGDFQCFRGVWRMQQTDAASTLLSYALYVKPQSWLPVGLIQGRIENEVVRNLEAVCKYAESQFLQRPQQQHQA